MPKMFSPSVPEAPASCSFPVSGKSREAEPLKTGTREIQVVQFKDRGRNRFVAGAVTVYGAGHGALWPRRNSALMFSVDGFHRAKRPLQGFALLPQQQAHHERLTGLRAPEHYVGLRLALARSNPAVSGAT